MASMLGLVMLFFDQLGRLVGGGRRDFATTAAIDFAHVLAATTGASQFVLGQVMNDFNEWQVSR